MREQNITPKESLYQFGDRKATIAAGFLGDWKETIAAGFIFLALSLIPVWSLYQYWQGKLDRVIIENIALLAMCIITSIFCFVFGIVRKKIWSNLTPEQIEELRREYAATLAKSYPKTKTVVKVILFGLFLFWIIFMANRYTATRVEQIRWEVIKKQMQMITKMTNKND